MNERHNVYEYRVCQNLFYRTLPVSPHANNCSTVAQDQIGHPFGKIRWDQTLLH